MRAVRPRIVLVTGASGGLGAAVAREAAREGHHLVLTARREGRLEALAQELGRVGAETLVVPADLADPDAHEGLIAAAVERFGGLDVLINNAGLGLPALFAQADPDELRRQIQVNFAAPLLLTRLALPCLLARKGMVINVGSAITCVANSALGAYGATKAGLAYWNDALRRELKHRGVRVCLVEPGPVATEFFAAMDIHEASVAGLYNPLRDPPPPLLTATAEVVARRIVGLINHPRRRLSVQRRVVWPNRLIGGLFQVAPWLGDLAIVMMTRHLEWTTGGTAMPRGSPQDVQTRR